MILEQRYITKQDILNKVNDITIYSTYLQEPVTIGARIESPFRKDKNPSFGFFKGTSEVCWKDFSTGETGDCFEFVKRLFPNFTYFDTLSKIATDLNLPQTGDFFYKDMSHIKTKIIELSESERNLLIEKANHNLQVKFRDWNRKDADFWLARGVTYHTLSYYNVRPVSHIFINDNIITADELAYCFSEYKDNQVTYKIYQPLNTKGLKWLSSHDSSVWQGWLQLPPKHDMLIITKSLKDIMSIATTTRIPSVALQSENTKPKKSVIDEINERFDIIYILYDNDYDKEVNVGRKMGRDLSRMINRGIQIEIPSEYESKDYSDFVMKHGSEVASNWLIKTTEIPF